MCTAGYKSLKWVKKNQHHILLQNVKVTDDEFCHVLLSITDYWENIKNS